MPEVSAAGFAVAAVVDVAGLGAVVGVVDVDGDAEVVGLVVAVVELDEADLVTFVGDVVALGVL